jgi:DNA-binding CsgD family transcriptional regulator
VRAFDVKCLGAQIRAARAAIIAKTFRLTPSEAKVACIIARGASPGIAAGELKISRETARNQLKSVFAKTDTHRQSELVALLLQVVLRN